MGRAAADTRAGGGVEGGARRVWGDLALAGFSCSAASSRACGGGDGAVRALRYWLEPGLAGVALAVLGGWCGLWKSCLGGNEVSTQTATPGSRKISWISAVQRILQASALPAPSQRPLSCHQRAGRSNDAQGGSPGGG